MNSTTTRLPGTAVVLQQYYARNVVVVQSWNSSIHCSPEILLRLEEGRIDFYPQLVLEGLQVLPGIRRSHGRSLSVCSLR